MAYFSEPVSNTGKQRRAAIANAARVRVQNGGTTLGALWTIPDQFKPAPTTTTTAPAPAPAPAPVYTAPAPLAPAPAPVTPTTYSQPLAPAPSPVERIPQGSGSGEPTAGQIATAAAGVLAPVSPVAAAAAAVAPAVAQALQAPDTTAIRFTTADIAPDGLLPEVYDADGTPVTPKAKAASFVDTLKNLPTPAKVGGAVLLFVLFSGGRR